MELIISAILVFISTSIDYVVVLTILFSLLHSDKKMAIYIGQYIGTGLLIGFSLVAAYFLRLIPEDWLIGLLGLIPLGLGIRAIFVDEDVNEEEIQERMTHNQSLILSVTALTIALGGDNLGVYIPYFTGMEYQEIGIVIGIFILGIFLLCSLAQYLATIPFVGEIVERYEKVIVPVVFIGLGVYILFENGTFAYLFQHFI